MVPRCTSNCKPVEAKEVHLKGEQNIGADVDGGMPEGLGEVRLADVDISDDENRGALVQVATGGRDLERERG
jgi:hypothetical protein